MKLRADYWGELPTTEPPLPARHAAHELLERWSLVASGFLSYAGRVAPDPASRDFLWQGSTRLLVPSGAVLDGVAPYAVCPPAVPLAVFIASKSGPTRAEERPKRKRKHPPRPKQPRPRSKRQDRTPVPSRLAGRSDACREQLSEKRRRWSHVRSSRARSRACAARAGYAHDR